MRRGFAWLRRDPGAWRGCKARKVRRVLRVSLRAEAGTDAFCWWNWAHPVCDQGQDPSCVGRAYAAWLRLMLVRYLRVEFHENEHLDGRAIWAKGREMYAEGDLSDGLQLDEGFMAMRELGMIPQTAYLGEVEPSWPAIAAQLTKTPMITGNVVHEGWFEPDGATGCIDHRPAPTARDGGHATCITAALVNADSGGRAAQAALTRPPVAATLSRTAGEEPRRFFGLEGSWGKDWPLHGNHILSESEYDEGHLAGPVTIVMPDGWEKFTGWEKYVVKT